MRKRKIYIFVILIAIASLLVYGCGNTGNDTRINNGAGMATADVGTGEAPGYKDVNASELNRMMGSDKNLLVVDVREKEEWDQGHIQGSVLIPLSEFQSRVNELPKDKNIVVVCATGSRSSQVADFLVQSGYHSVSNLQNGLMDWSYPLVK